MHKIRQISIFQRHNVDIIKAYLGTFDAYFRTLEHEHYIRLYAIQYGCRLNAPS